MRVEADGGAVGASPGSPTPVTAEWCRESDPTPRCSLHNHLPGYSLGRVIGGRRPPRESAGVRRPSLFDLARFALFSGVTILAAWIAAFGRVAYTIIMLVVAAALAYAVLDLVDMEIVKRKRRG